MEDKKPELQEESVKLMKMSKGYNWEIKLVGIINDFQLARLEAIDERIKEKFGDKYE